MYTHYHRRDPNQTKNLLLLYTIFFPYNRSGGRIIQIEPVGRRFFRICTQNYRDHYALKLQARGLIVDRVQIKKKKINNNYKINTET